MKRNKIKPKFLKQDTTLIEDSSINNQKNIFDKIEHIIYKSLFSFGLILLLIFLGAIPVLVFQIFNVDYKSFSSLEKIIITLINELLFLGLLFKFYKKDITKDFKNFFNENWKEHLKLALRYWGIGMIIMIISNYLIAIITNGQLAANEEEVRKLIRSVPIYMLFELMIYAPVSEELIFRRSIRDIVKNRYIYAILSGLIFGGLHAITSVKSAIDLLYFIPYCSLGYIFALLYSKTNNIFSTITIHSIHNTLALILYLISL